MNSLLRLVIAIFLVATANTAEKPLNYVGTTPAGKPIREILRIAKKAEAVEWHLTLVTNADQGAYFTLRGKAVFWNERNQKQSAPFNQRGELKIGRGTKSDPDSIVYELEGGLKFAQINENILHALDAERALAVGNGGFSYTLYRDSAAEKPGDLKIAMQREGLSYTNTPLSSGSNVFGVFEGRTPCNGIARAINSLEDNGCIKTKWRVTLFQDAGTKKPTNYKIDGSRYRGVAREGKWTIRENGTKTVYELAPAKNEGAIYLIKGNDDVLFFADKNEQPLVGHHEFGYTLNRRPADGFQDDPR